MVRVTTIVVTLAFLAAAPASSRLAKGPTYSYRVTGGSMTIETRETEATAGVERLSWTVAPHATADGSGGPTSFQLRFPVRGTYLYDSDEEESGTCRESFALAPSSTGTVVAQKAGSAKVRLQFGLDPRRRAGYAANECRPQTNNALRYFLANQASTTVTLSAGTLDNTTFTINARGRQTGLSSSRTTWQLSLSVTRLGR